MKEEFISRCCHVPVKYGKFYCLAALVGEEVFKCTECKQDPCEVEKKRKAKKRNSVA